MLRALLGLTDSIRTSQPDVARTQWEAQDLKIDKCKTRWTMQERVEKYVKVRWTPKRTPCKRKQSLVVDKFIKALWKHLSNELRGIERSSPVES